MTLGPVTFESLAWVLLAFAAPIAIVLAYLWDRHRRRQLARRLGELPVLARLVASASPGRRAAKTTLAALAAFALGIAVAHPTIRGKRRVEVRGLDLVVALDVSKSMMVDDVGRTEDMTRRGVEATRLARARELAVAVIDSLPGDRIAPVVFAGAATHFPLTADHEVAARFLYDLGPTDLPPGSNVGEVFRVARCLLRPDLYDSLGCAKLGRRGHGGDPLRGESLDPKGGLEDAEVVEEERGKAILLVTDGGEPDEAALREVRVAHELGIAVFVLGVGSTAGGIVYDLDSYTGKRTMPKHLANGQTVTSRRDDAAMKGLAKVAGDESRYVIANPTGEVDPKPIVDKLLAVNRGLATKSIDEAHDIYQPFVLFALLALVIEVAIGTRRRRAVPEGEEASPR